MNYGNVLLPLLLGTAEVAYCRLNNISLSLYVVAVLLMVISLLLSNQSGFGWTFYPPLSTIGSFSHGYTVALLLLGLVVMGFSTTLSSINFMATVLVRNISK
jgi:cytochrome c oxidase subunit 1